MSTHKNSKLEIRNSKQIQMIKSNKIPNRLVSDFGFEYFSLFRISSFGFRILTQDVGVLARSKESGF
jgi:hypothetical protein